MAAGTVVTKCSSRGRPPRPDRPWTSLDCCARCGPLGSTLQLLRPFGGAISSSSVRDPTGLPTSSPVATRQMPASLRGRCHATRSVMTSRAALRGAPPWGRLRRSITEHILLYSQYLVLLLCHLRVIQRSQVTSSVYVLERHTRKIQRLKAAIVAVVTFGSLSRRALPAADRAPAQQHSPSYPPACSCRWSLWWCLQSCYSAEDRERNLFKYQK